MRNAWCLVSPPLPIVSNSSRQYKHLKPTVGKNKGKYLRDLELIENEDFQKSAVFFGKKGTNASKTQERKSLILLGIVCWEYIHPSVISFCKSNQTLGGNSNVFQMLTLMHVDSFPLRAKFKSSLTVVDNSILHLSSVYERCRMEGLSDILSRALTCLCTG